VGQAAFILCVVLSAGKPRVGMGNTEARRTESKGPWTVMKLLNTFSILHVLGPAALGWLGIVEIYAWMHVFVYTVHRIGSL
jgi:hypothetical protein